jgi:signal transduction histidine kinase
LYRFEELPQMRENFQKLDLEAKSHSPSKLSQVLIDAVRSATNGIGLEIELDVPAGLDFPVDHDQIRLMVHSLTRAAAKAVEAGGEITLTAWQAGESLEIEVADNGPPLEQRPRYLPMSAAALKAELIWQNCPQGGAAVTAVIARHALKRSAA